MSSFPPADAIRVLNALIAAGRYADAADLATRGEAVWPDAAMFPFMSAHALAFLERPEDALLACLRAVAKDRHGLDPNALFMALLIQTVPPSHWPAWYARWRHQFPTSSDLTVLVNTLAGLGERYVFFSAWARVLLELGKKEEALRKFWHCLGPVSDGPPQVPAIIAEYADSGLAYDDNRIHRESVEGVASLLTHEFSDRSGLTLVDAGCGTGLAGSHLRALAGRLIGIDLSPDMLKRCRDTGLYDELLCGDLVQVLATMNDRVDGIICLGCTYYFPDLAPFLGVVRRVLDDSGHLLLIDYPAPPGAAVSQTISGTRRYCRSSDLLQRQVTNEGMKAVMVDVVPYFNLPAYFWRIGRISDHS